VRLALKSIARPKAPTADHRNRRAASPRWQCRPRRLWGGHIVLFRCGPLQLDEPYKRFDDLSRALSILRRLKALGVRIAVDDFGTGYSSLSSLQAFPFDKIKIDRSFISNLERSAQAATIVRAVIGLGRGLNLPVVAEGVETQAQLAFLSDEACAEIQGYLLGRPLRSSNTRS
jgi:EAL domain-containing protein (putative c-di-GMP-specific phosphodiesterase class I)